MTIPAPSRLRDREDLVGGASGAFADQHRDLLAAVEHLGGPLAVLLGRGDPGGRVAHAGAGDPVLEGRLLHGEVLHVGRQDHHGRLAVRRRDANGPVDHRLGLHRCRDRLHVGGHVTEEPLHVELLLEVGAQGDTGLLADDGDDRLVVAVGVVEPVHQMHGPGPGGGDADADLAGELGVGARHQRGHLLVGRPDVAEVLAWPARPAPARRRTRRSRRRGTRRTGADPTRSAGR